MRGLPSGTVTLLFTDIAGSTRLLEELGEHYADALAEHRRLLRATFEGHGGVEVDTQGDAFFLAFEKASDALAAAVDAQAALAAQGPIRARIGIHTGEPAVTEEGYVGIDVHRAARIAAAGHGGQILLSQSTRQLADRGDLLVNTGSKTSASSASTRSATRLSLRSRPSARRTFLCRRHRFWAASRSSPTSCACSKSSASASSPSSDRAESARHGWRSRREPSS